MAIAPNTTFSVGAVMTAAQQNAFGFSTVGLASSTSNYTLTTSIATTGLSVTFTAIASRNYKISWYEPQCQITNIVSGTTTMQLRVTNAAGTLLQNTFARNYAAVSGTSQMLCMYVGTFAAGSTTIVGCASTTSLSDGPVLGRQATAPGILVIEDIGPA